MLSYDLWGDFKSGASSGLQQVANYKPWFKQPFDSTITPLPALYFFLLLGWLCMINSSN